jgi:hypothetical protein
MTGAEWIKEQEESRPQTRTRKAVSPPASSRVAKLSIDGRTVDYYAVRTGRTGTKTHLAVHGINPVCGSRRVGSGVRFVRGPITCKKCVETLSYLEQKYPDAS